MSAPVLELSGVRVARGGVRVLDVPSFRLAADEHLALVGSNGSGKSSLLLTLMGLLPRESGHVLFRGHAPSCEAEAVALRRRMALVLQEPALFDTTVFENVAAGLRLRGVGGAELRDRVRAFLPRFHLDHLADRAARKLSGGEARRVSLARALVVEPEVVLLDEPFTGLDHPTRQAISGDLARVLREARVPTILVTHDPSEALRLCDRVVTMERGRVVGAAAPPPLPEAGAAAARAACAGLEVIGTDAVPA